MGNVTLVYGDGAVGKSLLLLQLCASTALGRNWLGLTTRSGVALYMTAEDAEDELHRRLVDIVTAEGVTLADLRGRLLDCSLVDQDAMLAQLDKISVLKPSKLLKRVEAEIARHKPDMVVIDTLADTFPGDEVQRAQARKFIALLRGVAVRHGCAIVVLAHPSLTGMQSGTGTSGSTGWNNSVRSRLYLESVKIANDTIAPNLRRLRRVKANYAPRDAMVDLEFPAGVFTTLAGTPEYRAEQAAKHAREVFLRLLDQFAAQGRYLNATSGTTYAPTAFAADPGSEGLSKKELKQAMDELFRFGMIAVETVRDTKSRHDRNAIVRTPDPLGDG